jgi:hypothetical protein
MPVQKNHYPEFEGEPEELADTVRLEMAFDAWKDANDHLSIRKAARQHGIPWETLRDRIKGAKPKAVDVESRQRLSAKEEMVIQKHI